MHKKWFEKNFTWLNPGTSQIGFDALYQKRLQKGAGIKRQQSLLSQEVTTEAGIECQTYTLPNLRTMIWQPAKAWNWYA